MSATYVLGVTFGVLVFVAVFLRMRNSGMKVTYGTWWLVIALASVVFSLFPAALTWISRSLGIVVPLNLGFFAAGVVLLLLSLQMSVDLSRAAAERRRLAEEIALLRAEVDSLRSALEDASTP